MPEGRAERAVEARQVHAKSMPRELHAENARLPRNETLGGRWRANRSRPFSARVSARSLSFSGTLWAGTSTTQVLMCRIKSSAESSVVSRVRS